ncbi:S8 family peptidase [Symbioplanes lichenis]|uniref:S8 family peptidase n=1 Tax=Symbioplanes lichenis TaxID=1629072 RepID=UPI002739D703|nr:S8 family peptidase [Actinoplanes lichenis]
MRRSWLGAAVFLAVALMPAPAHATGTVRLAGTAAAIPGSYLVVLKAPGPRTGALAARYDGSVTRSFDALHGFEAALTPQGARRLAADPAVAFVEQNQAVSLAAAAPSWGLDRIDQRDLPLSSSFSAAQTGADVTAYIVDTGIRYSHSDFGGRASLGHDAIGGYGNDCNGHGTHVAGTVGGATYGVAKQVTLVGVRVLNCSGAGTTAGVIAGVNWVTAHAVRPAVANLSLGVPASAALDAAVTASIDAGITYTLAAGNAATDACTISPARVPAALTVGATTSTDARAPFSNSGPCLDLFAPGVAISSDWYTADTAVNLLHGTSMAAPHVAGAAALVLSAHPGYTPAQVQEALLSAATPNKVTNPGAGSPNRLLFTG